ncbi:hypothetical protein SNOG_01239 [Parastagonospora nodorum SN15]|uniref:Uncharacterized protein n=1 Tax=Phaeosphaeria nodorum (strain SN15 / ATCC MYA-4574 / FGSC 10173) TaxID=321614 RepID=Q0V425_PHANO|nr:hypothetical protein SNOG_01239 [Parastagonospora nodorum SN15]EAT90888.1 hypothetical protein SNOG_01239 [Parastagonospora nodorum SN15]
MDGLSGFLHLVYHSRNLAEYLSTWESELPNPCLFLTSEAEVE